MCFVLIADYSITAERVVVIAAEPAEKAQPTRLIY
jgi:hypothetical protein